MSGAVSAADAVLVLSFGGPEGPDEVMPFLDNVLAGRDVPQERKLAVAEHYHHFGGVSPINAGNRELVAALRAELSTAGLDLPVYWGNRNWHPMLADTVASMREDGVRRALVFATSAFGSYSGCRQYRQDLAAATAAVPGAPALDKLRLFYDHPGFVAAAADGLRAALAGGDPADVVLFSAHSIPTAMADGSPYVSQLRVAAGLVAQRCGVEDWELVFQSRSGPPGQPWLEPDIGDRLRRQPPGSTVVVCPIGFVSDHMEVVWDLDTEAAALAADLGVGFRRAATAGTHPEFVSMIRRLVEERLDERAPRLGLDPAGSWPDRCPDGCCPAAERPVPRPSGAAAGARP